MFGTWVEFVFFNSVLLQCQLPSEAVSRDISGNHCWDREVIQVSFRCVCGGGTCVSSYLRKGSNEWLGWNIPELQASSSRRKEPHPSEAERRELISLQSHELHEFSEVLDLCGFLTPWLSKSHKWKQCFWMGFLITFILLMHKSCFLLQHNIQVDLILHFNQPVLIGVQKDFTFIGYDIADDTLIVTSCKIFSFHFS